MRLRLLKDGRQDVAGFRLVALRGLDVEHRRLERAAEGRRLFGLTAPAAWKLLDRVAQVAIQLAPQLSGVGAAAAQDPLAVRIVEQGVQQVLESQIGMPTRLRLAVRHVQHDLHGSGKHQASSIVARSGYPASRAMDVTVSTLVSAISHG